jgi:twinkle protein
MDAAEQVIASQHESCRIICPKCGPDRKHKNPTLSITVNPTETLYHCHHCEWSGCISTTKPIKQYVKRERVAPIPTKLNRDSGVIEKFFAQRGIEIPSLKELPPLTTHPHIYFPKLGENAEAVGFQYGEGDDIAIKWRPADGRKAFTQSGAARSFYGLDKLSVSEDGGHTVVIVEGEADVIALAAHGIRALSVPNGAPMKVSKNNMIDPEEDGKFAYVWEAREILDAADKIILAVDADEAGEALAEELARRIDRARCWRVKYASDCKDPTDVIVNHGIDEMRELIEKAEPMPLHGIYSAEDYRSELMKVYREGHGRGESTGFPVVDDLFTVKEGMVYIVTGLPGSGKSEFIDQIMVNLALNKSWKFALASFENPPATHIAKLSEKIIRKPFHEGPSPRMKTIELEQALEMINSHFAFIENKGGDMATMKSIINRAKQAVMRLGVRGLVIDPYNYIDMGNTDNEHVAISHMLSEISTFAKARNIAVFFVAHPAKMYPKEDGSYPVPKGMHISGSAAWFAKADIGLTIHRGEVGTEIHCWKVRHKWMGQIGQTFLGYDVPTGTYYERSDQMPNGKCAYKRSGWD